jgi:hypothetical protein
MMLYHVQLKASSAFTSVYSKHVPSLAFPLVFGRHDDHWPLL